MVRKGDVVYHRHEKNRNTGRRWRATVVSERIIRRLPITGRTTPCISVCPDGSPEGFSMLMPLDQVLIVPQHTAPLPFVTPYCWGYWWVRKDGYTCAWLGEHVLDAKIGGPVNGNAAT